MKRPNPKAPRVKGDARAPMMTQRIAAGLARLPALVPFSAATECDDVRAALLYVTRLSAFYGSESETARRAANREHARAARAAKGAP